MSAQVDKEAWSSRWRYPDKPRPCARLMAEALPDDALWGRIHAASVEEVERSIAALMELAARESADLPAFVTEELERGDRHPRWQDALVLVTERVLFPSADQRARVAVSLRKRALSLRDTREPASEQVLWAAVWRYTTLIPGREVGTLVDFLRGEDTFTTWQVALQSISNAFSRLLPDPSLPLGELRGRVEELAEQRLAHPDLGSAEERALAVSIYCAAAALASERFGEMTTWLIGLERGWMARRAYDRLAPVERAWSEAVPPSEPVPASLCSLRHGLERLEAAMVQTEGRRAGE